MSLASWSQSLGLSLTAAQVDALRGYVDLLAEAGEIINLTGLASVEAMERLLVLDALAGLLVLEAPSGARIVDLGTGGGVPGLPLAIMRPDCHFTLVDSREKKVGFVQWAADRLGLRNVSTRAARIEDLGRAPETREAFDVALAKALAPLPSLVELAVPLLAPQGYLLAWKGSAAAAEVEQAAGALRALDAEVRQVRAYALPDGDEARALVQIARCGPLPARFPRRVGLAQKQPL